MLRWHADLVENYEWVEDLGNREAFGRKNHRWIEKEAAGVVAAITAYNYPIQLALAKLSPALAAGCTVVLKGPPQTPWTTLALGKLIAEATDIPPGVVNVLVESGNAVGALLTTHPDVDVISFTGSTPVGRQIMAAASATVKRVFLELGGKSAFVLLDDGDINFAAMACGFAVISHSGQGCAITSRMVVPRKRHDEAVEAVRNLLANVKYGDPTDPATMMGPLISAQQREKVAGYVDRAVADGAKARDRRPQPAAASARLLLRADRARRRRRELRGRAGRAVRSGARGAPARRRRRRDPHREQLDLRALGLGDERRPRARARASRGASAPGP